MVGSCIIYLNGLTVGILRVMISVHSALIYRLKIQLENGGFKMMRLLLLATLAVLSLILLILSFSVSAYAEWIPEAFDFTIKKGVGMAMNGNEQGDRKSTRLN